MRVGTSVGMRITTVGMGVRVGLLLLVVVVVVVEVVEVVVVGRGGGRSVGNP